MRTGMRDRLYTTIVHHIAVYGYSPSYRELADTVGCSVGLVHHHLGVLEKQGRVTFRPGEPRTVRPAGGCAGCGREVAA